MLRQYGPAIILSAVIFVTGCSEGNPFISDTSAATDVTEPEAELPEPPEPELPTTVEPGSDAFETWHAFGDVSVVDASVDAPDMTITADKLQFSGDALLSGVWAQTSVVPGDRLTASVWLWADIDSQVVIYITPACVSGDEAPVFEYVSVTSEPTKFSVSHTFEKEHGCVQMQIKSLASPADISAWKATITRN